MECKSEKSESYTTVPPELPVSDIDRQRAREAVAAFCGYKPGPRWDVLVHNITVAICTTRWEQRRACVSDKPESYTTPRPITQAVLDELFAWTRSAPMFSSSPEGRVFGEEMREVINLACEALASRDVEVKFGR